MKNQDELLAQLGTIIRAGEQVLASETRDGAQKSVVHEEKFHDFRISALSFLARVFGHDSTFHQMFVSEVTNPTASRTRRGLGFLAAAAKELEGDWLESTRGALTRDVLTDMLRLASTQLEQKNLRAAVIIAGAILEKQLRNICLTNGIKLHNEIDGKAVAKRGLQLTGEAYKKKLYGRQDNKNIVSWLELAEAASGGKKEPLASEQAKVMISGVLAIINKIRY